MNLHLSRSRHALWKERERERGADRQGVGGLGSEAEENCVDLSAEEEASAAASRGKEKETVHIRHSSSLTPAQVNDVRIYSQHPIRGVRVLFPPVSWTNQLVQTMKQITSAVFSSSFFLI